MKGRLAELKKLSIDKTQKGDEVTRALMAKEALVKDNCFTESMEDDCLKGMLDRDRRTMTVL
jgi:hypothetical protein